MNYEGHIQELFARAYIRSAMRRGGKALRLRNWEKLVPEAFTRAAEKEAFLSSMEDLAQQGILRLGWSHRRKRDKLLWAELQDPQKLFANLGKPQPEVLDDKLRNFANQLESRARIAGLATVERFFGSLSRYPGYLEQLLDIRDIEDIYTLLAHQDRPLDRFPIRSLSVQLYRDSKRLESLLELIKPLAKRLKQDDLLSDLPRRSFPVAWIVGSLQLRSGYRVILEGGNSYSPMGLSLELLQGATDLEIQSARGQQGFINILSIENKESFFSLPRMGLPFDGFVYTNGWPNSAVRQILDLLHKGGYNLYHAGDLDIEGLAILEYLHETYGTSPFGMDLVTFERYRAFGRPLLNAEIRSHRFEIYISRLAPDLKTLAQEIVKSRIGIEQEIIDYREASHEISPGKIC